MADASTDVQLDMTTQPEEYVSHILMEQHSLPLNLLEDLTYTPIPHPQLKRM